MSRSIKRLLIIVVLC